MQRRKGTVSAAAGGEEGGAAIISTTSARAVTEETTLGGARQQPAESEWTTDTTDVSWKIGTQQASREGAARRRVPRAAASAATRMVPVGLG